MATQMPSEREQAGRLEGVWIVFDIRFIDSTRETVVSEPQPGLFIFGRTYYSAVWVPRGGPRKRFVKRFDPTPDEIVEAFWSIIANSGTYELSESTLMTHPIVTRMPEFAGGRTVYKYRLDGDRLHLEQLEEYLRDGTLVPRMYHVRLSLRRVE